MVIPKRHVGKLSELSKDEKEELLNFIIEYQEKILNNVAQGCDIRQNYRPFMKQGKLKIDHLHIHLLPREFDDDLYLKCQIFEKTIFKPLTQEEINKISKLLE